MLNIKYDNETEGLKDMNDSIKQCDNHFKSWKTYFTIAINTFKEKGNKIEYGKLAFEIISHALKYKPYKTRL